MMSETPLPSDNDLLAAYYRGDNDAFDTMWFGRKKPRRTGYAVRIDRYLARQFKQLSEADREDLVSEVGMRLVRSKDDGIFDFKQEFRPWVFTIVLRKALDFVRRKGNHLVTGVESEDGGPLDAHDHRVPEAYPFDDEAVNGAYQAIDELPALQRNVLLLRLNWLKNEDVAMLLGISQPNASKLFKNAIAQVGAVMSEHASDAPDSLNPLAERFFRRLQERHEHELAVAFERMRRHGLTLDAEGRIVGFTKAAQRGDLEYIGDHLRGVLPVYLHRQGVPTSHANTLNDLVVDRLDAFSPAQRFRDFLSAALTEYCAGASIVPQPARDEAEFLHRVLVAQSEGFAWAADMQAWLAEGTIRRLDDLVDPLQWPASLNKQPSFRNRMCQLHGSLLATLRTESDLLDDRGPSNPS